MFCVLVYADLGFPTAKRFDLQRGQPCVPSLGWHEHRSIHGYPVEDSRRITSFVVLISVDLGACNDSP